MKVAITSQGESVDAEVDPRFGRSKYFIIWDTETKTAEAVDNAQNLNAAQGAGIQSAQNVIDKGCEALVSGHLGPKAFGLLKQAGVKVYLGATCSVSDAISRLEKGELAEADSPDVQGHW